MVEQAGDDASLAAQAMLDELTRSFNEHCNCAWHKLEVDNELLSMRKAARIKSYAELLEVAALLAAGPDKYRGIQHHAIQGRSGNDMGMRAFKTTHKITCSDKLRMKSK